MDYYGRHRQIIASGKNNSVDWGLILEGGGKGKDYNLTPPYVRECCPCQDVGMSAFYPGLPAWDVKTEKERKDDHRSEGYYSPYASFRHLLSPRPCKKRHIHPFQTKAWQNLG